MFRWALTWAQDIGRTGVTRANVHTMSEVIRQESVAVRVGCLSGPNLALEILGVENQFAGAFQDVAGLTPGVEYTWSLWAKTPTVADGIGAGTRVPLVSSVIEPFPVRAKVDSSSLLGGQNFFASLGLGGMF